MAAPSGDDIPAQLAALLGRDAVQIRKTDESPPRISIIDVARAIAGHNADYSSLAVRNVCDQYPDVRDKITDFKFKGRGQRATPVTGVHGIIEVVMLLPGQQAARVRRHAAELLCRWLGGDLTMIDEVCRSRRIQEGLAVQSPADPRRIFGEAVEAAAPAMGEQQLARVCTDIVTRAMPAVLERVTAHIDERLANLASRQRVNLNVRAPKRPAPYARPLARDISHAGRPLPVSKFIDEKERADLTLKDVRKSFVPGFSMVVQILKKNQLRRDGASAVYVEQNHRPQILYTEDDRPIMEEAWALTEAHREDLSGARPAAAGVSPAAAGSHRTQRQIADYFTRPRARRASSCASGAIAALEDDGAGTAKWEDGGPQHELPISRAAHLTTRYARGVGQAGKLIYAEDDLHDQVSKVAGESLKAHLARVFLAKQQPGQEANYVFQVLRENKLVGVDANDIADDYTVVYLRLRGG